MTSHERAGDAGGGLPGDRKSRLTFVMILTAFSGVLLAMICADATVGALLWAMLEIAGVARAAIGWTEGVLLLLSLIPAVWLFRQALISEREMAGGPAG